MRWRCRWRALHLPSPAIRSAHRWLPPPRLRAGELRALRPGSGWQRQRSAVSGASDFSYPAVVGLAALFSPSSIGDSSAGGKHAAPAGSLQTPGEPDAAWQQRALALSDCQLWRVDAHALYASLRDTQPAVLLHLLRHLLVSLGAASSGNGAAYVSDQLGPLTGDQQPPASSSKRQARVDHLLRVQQELQQLVDAAAAAAALAAATQQALELQQRVSSAGAAPASPFLQRLGAVVPAGIGRPKLKQSSVGSAMDRESTLELESVGINPSGPSAVDPDELPADVWHPRDG